MCCPKINFQKQKYAELNLEQKYIHGFIDFVTLPNIRFIFYFKFFINKILTKDPNTNY